MTSILFFIWVLSAGQMHLAAMYLGNTATRSVTVASQFDTNTGGKIITKQLLG